jgi:H+/Cl- antiporter ClcA
MRHLLVDQVEALRMAGTTGTTPNASPPNHNPPNDNPPRATPPTLWRIILVALVANVLTATWLSAYHWLTSAIWSNAFMTTHRWTVPVGVVFFSLLVGLAQQFLWAPNVIHGGGLTESLKGGREADYSTFPRALLSSYFSLSSGVSVGPEGSLSLLVQDIAAWLREKLNIAEDTARVSAWPLALRPTTALSAAQSSWR